MSASDGEHHIQKPFGAISTYNFSGMFRALVNAALAIEAFTNHQNYGPAIQQLIYDLSELSNDYVLKFDLPKLSNFLGKICDQLDADDFDSIGDVEMRHGCIYLWDHGVTAEDRLKYYKDRYRYDRELNPVEKT